jgi:Uma2 family endonuclease
LRDFGKAPEVAVEIVSNKVGHELTSKLRDYARIGVDYYVVYAPGYCSARRNCAFMSCR